MLAAKLGAGDPEASWQPLDPYNFTCFGSTMGTGQFQSAALELLETILNRTRKHEPINNPFVTSILVNSTV